MKRAFFIVGPTATGKSEIAAEIARQLNAEIVSADAFQIYRGLDLLTAKPGKATLAKAQHHLLSVVPLSEEMNVEKFRGAAVEAIRDIHARGKDAIVAGGSGLYIKALTHGLSPLPGADPKLRAQLSRLDLDELREQLVALDPVVARQIDTKNRRRVTRALEICLLTGKPVSEQRMLTVAASLCEAMGEVGVRGGASHTEPATGTAAAAGVFVFRERAELYERINRRVEKMFAEGVAEEVRLLRDLGSTAEKTLGLREIRTLLAGESSEAECIAKIQQATRHYAKRQLTWFQRQDNFEPLNLSSHGSPEAIEWIAQNARLAFAQRDV
ncbi:MAG: tRNA dimethylallyltransferase [Verrucomicrobiota bacterium]|jgi:tRNA dimethylallyltransferase